MLEKLHVEGFRILREFSWNLNEGANILVGANSAGKSTILDSVELVIRGGLNGIRAYNALAPDLRLAKPVQIAGRKLAHLEF